jgi:type I restriction enzyme S subunit
MNAERLLAHFERISEAPGAIARLRRFILDLAVRGKLVEQDPEDEPAEELLGRILELKIRSTGKLPKSNSQMIDRLFDDEPFAIPDSWTWVVLGQITDLITSGSRDWAKHYSNSGAIFVRMGNLVKCDYRLRLDSIQHVSPPAGGEGTRTRLEAWDVLVSITGDVGMLGLIPEGFGEAYINQHTALARPCFLLKGRYLPEFLRSDFAQNQFQEPQRGIKNSFRLSDLSAIVVPLPPLAEQQRIVAKVDELMALCDQLEAARQQRQQGRERLVAATLHRLNQPAEDPASFRQDASFALQVLPSLTTTPAQIKQLRQTILNLAVRGKLVEQDPEDEPAEELSRQISLERKWLVKTGAIPNKKPAVRDPARLMEDLPINWDQVALGDLCNLVTSGSRGWAEYYSETGVGFIRAQNIRFGRLLLGDMACVQLPPNSEGSRTRVEQNDLFVVITGAGVTNPALLDQDVGEAYVSQHVGLIRPTDKSLSLWLLLCLMAPAGGRDELVQRAYGSGKPGLNLDNIRSLTIPLPPLAEQHRIVDKVDELMALCDQLEQQLSQADQQRRRLLEAVLAEALGG